ncbi:sensor histidine kinase [Nonlabens xiamenensis]|uniref:sensor histidine kinase n=1 Tax=Nonlabens xiamenensis TaxID=2341043 RepID=UPI000F612F77|nr:ATP-binding protein [Nonlabens xiamenensis]
MEVVIYICFGLIIGFIISWMGEEWEAHQRQLGIHRGTGSYSSAHWKHQWEIIQAENKSSLPITDPYKQEMNLMYVEWASAKPVHLLSDLEDYTKRLQAFCRDKIDTDLDYKINFPEQGELRFSALEVWYYLRILTECLHNAVIHAQADFVFVIATWEENVFTLIIHDNGTGFQQEAFPDGSGLDMVQRAVIKLDASLEISSITGNGTVVRVINSV